MIVWLHNDHARYGAWRTPAGPVTAAGNILRSHYPGQVFTVGLLMGHGAVANNARQLRPLIPIEPGDLEAALRRPDAAVTSQLLTGSSAPPWARRAMPYRRNGLSRATLVPAQEFDAVIYVDSVMPASYLTP